MNMPIIRLEVEGLKYTVSAALSEHAAQMDEDIKSAVEEYCNPENLRKIIKKAAWEHLQNAIESEVRNFFVYGNGKTAVAEAVRECILTNKTYTNMDNIA